MVISRILGAVSLVIVAVAPVSVATSWNNDVDPSVEASLVVRDQEGGTIDVAAVTQVPSGSESLAGSVPAPTAAPTTAPAAPAAATTSVVRLDRSAELAFTGDIVPAPTVGRLARHYAQGSSARFDFVPMFERVAAELSSVDVAICHIDSPVAEDGDVVGGSTRQLPSALAEAVAATGWDGCSLASDHAFDQGANGVRATSAAFEASGLGRAGLAIEGSQPAQRYDANDIDVAHLSYTSEVAGRGFQRGVDSIAVIDPDAIVADAEAARSGGADFVVVSLHWGEEFVEGVTAAQRNVAEALAASGSIDLIIGHHAHLVQPLEKLDSTWVAFGLGNFLTNDSPSCCPAASEDGVILHVDIADTVDGVAITSISFTPTWVDRVQMQVMPVATRLGDAGLAAWYRAVLRNAWDRTESTLLSRGAADFGVAATGPRP